VDRDGIVAEVVDGQDRDGLVLVAVGQRQDCGQKNVWSVVCPARAGVPKVGSQGTDAKAE
jgi:hypothetical protein